MSPYLAGIRNRAGHLALRGLLRQRLAPRRDMVRLGSAYGGYAVPTSLLSASSVCYCAGVGEDVSFDLALIERFGCQVFAFDPTPRAATYVREKAQGIARFRFYEMGLWSRNERVRFFAPKDPAHVSYSIVNLQGTSTFFEAECRRLSSLMRDLGHRSLDLLKLDIEGAEYAVLESILEDKVSVWTLCVEFDQPTPLKRITGMIGRLIEAGYTLVSVDGWHCTLVRRDFASP